MTDDNEADLERSTSPLRKPDRVLVFHWTLATAAGLVLIPALSAVTGSSASASPISIAALVVSGILLGYLQMLVLRRYVAASVLWVVTTFFGGLIGFTFAGVLFVGFVFMSTAAAYDSSGPLVPLLVIYLLASLAPGFVLGGMQYFELRKLATKAGWWMLISSLAYVLLPSLAFVALLGLTSARVPWQQIGAIAITILAVTVPGLITGFGMRWILKYPRLADIENGT